MRYRKPTNYKKDNRIFKHTAMNTKKINIRPHISRGGIQLWWVQWKCSVDYAEIHKDHGD